MTPTVSFLFKSSKKKITCKHARVGGKNKGFKENESGFSTSLFSFLSSFFKCFFFVVAVLHFSPRYYRSFFFNPRGRAGGPQSSTPSRGPP